MALSRSVLDIVTSFLFESSLSLSALNDPRGPWARRDVCASVLKMAIYHPKRLSTADFSFRAHRRRLLGYTRMRGDYTELLNFYLALSRGHPLKVLLAEMLSSIRAYSTVNPQKYPICARFVARAVQLACQVDFSRELISAELTSMMSVSNPGKEFSNPLIPPPLDIRAMVAVRRRHSRELCMKLGEAFVLVSSAARALCPSLMYILGRDAGTFLGRLNRDYFRYVLSEVDRRRWNGVGDLEDLAIAGIGEINENDIVGDDGDYGWESYADSNDVADMADVADVVDGN